MQIKTATLPFDIATKGASVRNQSVINSEHSEYVEGTSGTYSNPSGTSGTYYTDDSLLLRYTPEVDDPNTTDVYESIPPDISPGSSGELSLYVIPKTDSSLKVKVSLNVIAFAEIDKYDVSTKTVTNPETDEVGYAYTVRVHKDLLKTQPGGSYVIPISFRVKTGDRLFHSASGGCKYSNYKVTVSAALYSAISGNGISTASYDDDHIIYTNARVLTKVID